MPADPIVSPAVDAILHSAGPAQPGRPVKTGNLSMSKEAQRSRDRRAAEKLARSNAGQNVQSPPAPPAAPPAPAAPAEPPEPGQFTPGHLQLMPDGPARSTVTPEEMERAVRNWSLIVRAAGLLAAKIGKGDELKVPPDDARDCAEAILDGWPELVHVSDADFKKLMAVVIVGSVGNERWELYKAARGRPVGPAIIPAAEPKRPTSSLTEFPLT